MAAWGSIPAPKRMMGRTPSRVASASAPDSGARAVAKVMRGSSPYVHHQGVAFQPPVGSRPSVGGDGPARHRR